MRQELFKQCELTKPAGDGVGVARMVSWIPARIALVNRRVRLKDPETGDWTDGWTVVYAAPATLPAKVLERQSRDHLKTRRASDV